MEMTNKEFSNHFSDKFTPEIKSFGERTLFREGLDCLIVLDREDKEKAYCTHCKKVVKIPGDSLHTGSPRNAWRREREEACHCHHGYMSIPEEELQRREDIKARKNMTCPSCRCELPVYHQWRMDMSQMNRSVSISVWAKSKVEPGAVVMRRIEIDRYYGNDADHVVKDEYTEAERYLFRMGQKAVRQNCLANWWDPKKKKTVWGKRFVKSIADRALRQSNFAWTDYIGGHYSMAVGSLLDAIQDTPYQYLFRGGEVYLNHYTDYVYRTDYPLLTVGFMNLYSLHPWIELLIKNGMENIVVDHIRGNGCKGAICWGARTIKSAVKRFTKQDLKDVMEYNKNLPRGRGRINETDLQVLAEYREKAFPKLTLTSAVIIAREGLGTFERMLINADILHVSAEKVLAYCIKQNSGKGHAMGDWLDYLGDARRIGLDLTQERNIFPKDLVRMHANISRQIEYQHDKALKEKLEETLAVRNKLFSWKGKKYFIRPAESTDELIAEGQALHHCVGGYAKKHAMGETTILFVRENENPNKPLYTMEVQSIGKYGWKIEQIRGNMNAAPPEEVLITVEQFMEQVNAKVKKKKVRKTA